MPDYRTLVEVAADLRVRPRWLRELVRAKQIPVLRRGRVIRFDDVARCALDEALRAPSSKSPPRPLMTRPAQFVPMSPDAAFAAALKATAPVRRAPGGARRPPRR